MVGEDNEANQMYIKHVLALMGCDALVVGDGRQVVDQWRNKKPSIILMDLSMPTMDGYNATALIRKIEAEKGFARIPILALTAHAMASDAESCKAGGMDGHLPKPLSMKLLEAKFIELGVFKDEGLGKAG